MLNCTTYFTLQLVGGLTFALMSEFLYTVLLVRFGSSLFSFLTCSIPQLAESD